MLIGIYVVSAMGPKVYVKRIYTALYIYIYTHTICIYTHRGCTLAGVFAAPGHRCTLSDLRLRLYGMQRSFAEI